MEAKPFEVFLNMKIVFHFIFFSFAGYDTKVVAELEIYFQNIFSTVPFFCIMNSIDLGNGKYFISAFVFWVALFNDSLLANELFS